MTDQATTGTLDAADCAASLIIPLRASSQLFQWEERLAGILAAVPPEFFEILIVDYGTAPAVRSRLDAIVEAAPAPVRLIRHDRQAEPFSIGQARDLGAMAATAPVILFNDLDFIAPRQTYAEIAQEIRRRDLASFFDQFFCVPVVFLTEQATQSYMAGGAVADAAARHARLLEAALKDDGRTSVSVAYGSSCMVANRLHYLALGGHDQTFWGHGAEDYELLHRLFASIGRAPRPPYYEVDFKDNGIRHYRGFRAAFALFGIDLIRLRLFLVHLPHPSRRGKNYARRRKRNFRLLQQRMRQFDRTGRHPPPLPDPHRGRSLVVTGPHCPPPDDLRYLMPLMGSVTFAGEAEFSGAEQLIGFARDGRFDRVVVGPSAEDPKRQALMEALVRSGVPCLTLRPAPTVGSWALAGDEGTLAPPGRSQPEGTMLPFDSPVFESFGGAAALWRAEKLRRNAGGTGPQARIAAALLQLFGWAVAWRLPRRQRILLRRAPAEYFAEHRPRSPILRWLGRAEH